MLHGTKNTSNIYSHICQCFPSTQTQYTPTLVLRINNIQKHNADIKKSLRIVKVLEYGILQESGTDGFIHFIRINIAALKNKTLHPVNLFVLLHGRTIQKHIEITNKTIKQKKLEGSIFSCILCRTVRIRTALQDLLAALHTKSGV